MTTSSFRRAFALLLALGPVAVACAATRPSAAPAPLATTVPAVARQPAGSASPNVALEPLPAQLQQPVHITHAGDGSGRLFVVEKRGRIVALRDGAAQSPVFLDISSRVNSSGSEQGLLGLAFHPRYAESGRLFVGYTARNGDQIVATYQVSANPDVADSGTEKVILRMQDPAVNHNGGLVLFGPDGYLWIGTGDGGGAGDRYGNGQNRQSLLGKMLRIDVDNGDPYSIPPDNPFAGSSDTRPEIWALGLRNPWRYAFDRANGDLYIGDVGQNAWEEIDIQRAGSRGGENYGWPAMEGNHCFRSPCDAARYVPAIAEYGRDGGCSVTGGHVYRGTQFPQLWGRYIFGDFCTGKMWSLDEAAPNQWRMAELPRVPIQISSFGEDESGELYVAGYGDGRIYRVVVP